MKFLYGLFIVSSVFAQTPPTSTGLTCIEGRAGIGPGARTRSYSTVFFLENARAELTNLGVESGDEIFVLDEHGNCVGKTEVKLNNNFLVNTWEYDEWSASSGSIGLRIGAEPRFFLQKRGSESLTPMSLDLALEAEGFPDGSDCVYIAQSPLLPVSVTQGLEDLILSMAYPNPANSQTNVNIQSNKTQQVKIEVYDLLGRKVIEVFEGQMQANERRVINININSLASGKYILRLIAGEEIKHVPFTKVSH